MTLDFFPPLQNNALWEIIDILIDILDSNNIINQITYSL